MVFYLTIQNGNFHQIFTAERVVNGSVNGHVVRRSHPSRPSESRFVPNGHDKSATVVASLTPRTRDAQDERTRTFGGTSPQLVLGFSVTLVERCSFRSTSPMLRRYGPSVAK